MTDQRGPMLDLAALLERYRRERGLTQNALALQLGMSQSWVARLLGGKLSSVRLHQEELVRFFIQDGRWLQVTGLDEEPSVIAARIQNMVAAYGRKPQVFIEHSIWTYSSNRLPQVQGRWEVSVQTNVSLPMRESILVPVPAKVEQALECSCSFGDVAAFVLSLGSLRPEEHEIIRSQFQREHPFWLVIRPANSDNPPIAPAMSTSSLSVEFVAAADELTSFRDNRERCWVFREAGLGYVPYDTQRVDIKHQPARLIYRFKPRPEFSLNIFIGHVGILVRRSKDEDGYSVFEVSGVFDRPMRDLDALFVLLESPESQE